MKYSMEERLSIGKEIYDRDLSYSDACIKYDLNGSTVRTYERLYRETNHLPRIAYGDSDRRVLDSTEGPTYIQLMEMSKGELIDEIIKSRVDLERLKKGYRVTVNGTEKEFKPIKKTNLK